MRRRKKKFSDILTGISLITHHRRAVKSNNYFETVYCFARALENRDFHEVIIGRWENWKIPLKFWNEEIIKFKKQWEVCRVKLCKGKQKLINKSFSRALRPTHRQHSPLHARKKFRTERCKAAENPAVQCEQYGGLCIRREKYFELSLLRAKIFDRKCIKCRKMCWLRAQLS